MFRWSLMGRGSETGIAPPSPAALGHCVTLAGSSEIHNLLTSFGVKNDGADRDRYFEIGAVPARAVAALAVTTAFRGMSRVKAKV